MSSVREIKTFTVKEAVANLDQWQLQPPVMNKFTHKKEAHILCNGEPALVQIGTPKQPIFSNFGPSRWSQQDNKFIAVDGRTDVQWAHNAQADSTFQRAQPGGKLQHQLTLHEYDVEGTQGNLAYTFITGIVERVIKGLAYGVPDRSKPDANGRPTIVQVVDVQQGAASDPIERERLFRYSLSSPVQPPSGTYAPSLKTKMRYSVKKTATGGEMIGLDMQVLDASRPAETRMNPVDIKEQWALLKARCRGVYIIKINPITFKKNEINMTIDVVKALIMPSQSMFQNVSMRLEDEDADVEMNGDGDHQEKYQRQELPAIKAPSS